MKNTKSGKHPLMNLTKLLIERCPKMKRQLQDEFARRRAKKYQDDISNDYGPDPNWILRNPPAVTPDPNWEGGWRPTDIEILLDSLAHENVAESTNKARRSNERCSIHQRWCKAQANCFWKNTEWKGEYKLLEFEGQGFVGNQHTSVTRSNRKIGGIERVCTSIRSWTKSQHTPTGDM